MAVPLKRFGGEKTNEDRRENVTIIANDVSGVCIPDTAMTTVWFYRTRLFQILSRPDPEVESRSRTQLLRNTVFFSANPSFKDD